ncbi:hypothetical protein ACFYKT_13815 [Cytobacillus sp. FJAT-53684]|uniref:Permease n=1 Tax=Cytobacillus mangrovibacter TaxID=3299024 RepID=A0ABW6K280_9BACI
MKLKKSLGYFAYTLGFVILLIFISKLQLHFENIFKETFKMYPWVIYMILLNIPIGIYLGIPSFIEQIKKSGRWKMNWGKLVLISLPMLIIAFFWFVPFSYHILEFLINLGLTMDISTQLGAMVAGYFLINSVYKE